MVVEDVAAYPGHIACDGDTKSEVVLPVVLRRHGKGDIALGVLDLDCLALGGFDHEDCKGLERVVDIVVKKSYWGLEA